MKVAVYTKQVLGDQLSAAQYERFQQKGSDIMRSVHHAPGFVRLVPQPTDDRERTYDTARVSSTLSIWDNIVSLYTFTYQLAIHRQAMREFRGWTVESPFRHVMWWIEDDHDVTWAMALTRMATVTEQGPTPVAFAFPLVFDEYGAHVSLPHIRL